MTEQILSSSNASLFKNRKKYKRTLTWSFGLVGGYFFVELITGLVTNSLALISDAGHMLTDVIGLGMSLAALHALERSRHDKQKTFGLYRLEILAALANAILLFAVALYILYEAIRRMSDPPSIPGIPMLVVATVGLIINGIVFLALKQDASQSLNIEGAYLEVLSDFLGSIAVVIAAVVISFTRFYLIDPLFSLLIGFFVLPRTWRLGHKAIRILLQEAPPHIKVDSIQKALSQINGVACVHDIHVWTLTSGIEVCSVHLTLGPNALTQNVLESALRILKERFNIVHPTVQIEPFSFKPCPHDTDHHQHLSPSLSPEQKT